MNIIQEIINGVAECPKLIKDDTDALRTYVKMAKENGLKYDFDLVNTFSYSEVDKFITAVKEYFSESDYELLWWDTAIDE